MRSRMRKSMIPWRALATALSTCSTLTAICCGASPAADRLTRPGASRAFGQFSAEILIGNFGDGKINVFDSRGRFIDELDGPYGKALVIDGLWTLTLGGGAKSSSDTLYFTAGPNGETDGLFGTITPASNDRDY